MCLIKEARTGLGLSENDLQSLSKLVGTPFVGYLSSCGVFIGENGKTFSIYKNEEPFKNMMTWVEGNYSNVEEFYTENRGSVQRVLKQLGEKAIDKGKVSLLIRNVGILGFCDFSGIPLEKFNDSLHKEAFSLYLSDDNGETFNSYAKEHGVLGEDGRVKLNPSVLDDYTVIPAILDELSKGNLSRLLSDNPSSTRYIISEDAVSSGQITQDTVIVERKIGFSAPLCKVGGSYYSDDGSKEAIRAIIWSDEHQDWLLSSKPLQTAKEVLEHDPIYVIYSKSAEGYFKYKKGL